MWKDCPVGKSLPDRKFAPQRHLASSAAPRPHSMPHRPSKGRGFPKGGKAKGKGFGKGKGGRGKGPHRPIHALDAELDDSGWYEDEAFDDYDAENDYEEYENYDYYADPAHAEEYGFEEAYVLDDAYTPHDLDPGHEVAPEGSPDPAEA